MDRSEIDNAPRRMAVAVATVAQHLMAIEIGDQVPTVAELATESGTGTGTVQAALKTLTDAGAAEVTRHGQKGTVLVERDLGLLWEAASRGPVTGILPLPGSIEMSGLATAVTESFNRADIPLTLAFRLGSTKRIEFLSGEGADFIACSLGYAQTLDPKHFEFIDLGPSTYHSHDSAAVITRSGDLPGPGSRIGIDHQSFDHETRSEAEFPGGDFVECAYPLIPDLIVRGEIDAAIWHRTSASPLSTATSLSIHPLSMPAPPENEDLGHAALVTDSRDESPAWHMLCSLIVPEQIQTVQMEVVDAKRVPSY